MTVFSTAGARAERVAGRALPPVKGARCAVLPSAVAVTVRPSARDLGRAQVQLYRVAALAAFGPACLRLRGLRRVDFWDGCARPSDGAAAGNWTAVRTLPDHSSSLARIPTLPV
jgi:hypothetical protein